ncbi:S-methyl-5-thioribose-1-phosphate isomerase [Marinobacter sp. M216]|uniref:Methylthioribose-1-phosphate isomerase n=1 Tax=Marinobacter albus TaxID=3030833 RepID=A0ABT7HGB3_9GAMM|nr:MULTISPECIES: S-methyl-5-thioribose-1-phosphate isomerase [unclassified Marinobacter]MBW7472387.1 S-methyl-5-thioribose-1-phosphate isomerase [Marinobacter sp. F4218]MDK9558937.1 S-methyl-5-thioribose-1-phosphate isomerase [Marinobacter sp. M216]
MATSPTNPSSRAVGTVAIRWHGHALELLDQRLLPVDEHWITLEGASSVAQCIRDMVVRGAPAIGISAAYGVALAARHAGGGDWKAEIKQAIRELAASRPTAVNLFWALQRMEQVFHECHSLDEAVGRLASEAVRIHEEDLAANLAMADHALGVIRPDKPISVLTHCNTGALATGGYGTALGVIRRLHEENMLQTVYADETRPWLQGSRLTAWELAQEGIPVTLNADGAAAAILADGHVRWVVVGADRITANGDVANKIGTYSLAVLARHHKVGFMVVAPSSTVDMSLASGQDIPIEEREGTEIREIRGVPLAPAGVKVFNPVFDVTPASLIDAIVTEKGVVHNPNITGMRELFG